MPAGKRSSKYTRNPTLETLNEVIRATTNYYLLYGRITVRSHPNTSECVRIYLVAEELASTVIMDIDTTRKTMVDTAIHHGGVGFGPHFYTGDSVVVDVVLLIVALMMIKENIDSVNNFQMI